MNIESFLAHYNLTENPFAAEEARHDPVFHRLADQQISHPEFHKVLGDLGQPSTAIIFGEKGSGKTAIRLMLSRYIEQYNSEHTEGRLLDVVYDDLNPVLDHVMRARGGDPEKMLQKFRLEDHQDAILSRAVTRLVDTLLDDTPPDVNPLPLPTRAGRRIRKALPYKRRIDMASLAALYDQPRSGSVVDRFDRLWRRLRLGWRPGGKLISFVAAVSTLAFGALLILDLLESFGPQRPWWMHPSMGLAAAAALLLWAYRIWHWFRVWRLARRVRRELPTVDRHQSDLEAMLARIPVLDRDSQPFPGRRRGSASRAESRYDWTRRLLDVIDGLGYYAMIVLIDRIDEPTLVSGDAEKMKWIIWPMLDNKFLQQERIGFKMMLPLELRHLVHRESSVFFQEARLDKQNMIDRLVWSGQMLYDLCCARLRACCSDGDGLITLTNLFEESVTREMLIDALDRMSQPRDAFKFLYATIQEHCRNTPQDRPTYRIARLTLESVCRMQADRVKDLHRGLTPS